MHLHICCATLITVAILDLTMATLDAAAQKLLKKKNRPKGLERETVFQSAKGNITWPYRDQVAVVEGDIMLGGLMMVHERDEQMICGKIMPQGGLQATEMMLYTLDVINKRGVIPGIKLGARIKDDCDRDIYGLEQSVDFIRGNESFCLCFSCNFMWNQHQVLCSSMRLYD